MRSSKLWLSALVGLTLSLSPAWALPVPKLPPEATDKPSVVVRVRPIAELIKDVRYVAKLVGQEEVFDAVEPGIAPVLETLDQQKPIGFYAKIVPNGIDSHGILMLPVKNVKDFVGLLNTLGINANEGQNGLYTVNAPGAPFPILFRFSNGYIYATVRNTPEAEAGLALNKLFAPPAIFKQGDDSVASVTFNTDALPNDLKRKGLELLEEGLRTAKNDEIPKQKNAMVRAFLETAVEELAGKVQALIVDTQSVGLRFDLDRTKEDLGFAFRLTPRPNTVLAQDLATAGSANALGFGITTPDSAGHLSINIAVPASLRKTLDPLVDDLVANGWKKAKDNEQPFAKELLEILAPTLKAGLLDVGIDLRGPDRDKFVAVLFAVNVQNADKLEALARKIYAASPEEEKKSVKLDVGKVGDVALHQLQDKDKGQDFDTDLIGPDPATIVAFRKDAVLFAVGPVAEATAAVKSAVPATPKASQIVQGQLSIRKFAPIMERKDPGAVEAAKKAYPAGVNDTYRLNITGGSDLEVRFSAGSRIIQFGYLLEQSRRNR